ncbi:hypothetical protein EV182_001745 [Spiromyces aspiralis]|uniref:Uncharacterized protein n=1 Tax=Spiromyces aspiralis TaxID=68401 RepID=A0ACC1HW89_9FUNG|nr:hypothetical protein EV182_001745 [Spiromyces aspiralis]
MADAVAAQPVRFRTFADARPMGWGAFAIALFILGLHSGAIALPFNSSITSIDIAAFFFIGGVVLLLAGLWSFPNNDTFGATLFTVYGALFLALGYIGSNGSIGPNDTVGLDRPNRRSYGSFFLAYVLFNFFIWLSSIRTHIGHNVFLILLEVTWILLSAGSWNGKRTVVKTGGWFAFFASLVAFYHLASTFLNRDNFLIDLPSGRFGHRRRDIVEQDIEAGETGNVEGHGRHRAKPEVVSEH